MALASDNAIIRLWCLPARAWGARSCPATARCGPAAARGSAPPRPRPTRSASTTSGPTSRWWTTLLLTGKRSGGIIYLCSSLDGKTQMRRRGVTRVSLGRVWDISNSSGKAFSGKWQYTIVLNALTHAYSCGSVCLKWGCREYKTLNAKRTVHYTFSILSIIHAKKRRRSFGYSVPNPKAQQGVPWRVLKIWVLCSIFQLLMIFIYIIRSGCWNYANITLKIRF